MRLGETRKGHSREKSRNICHFKITVVVCSSACRAGSGESPDKWSYCRVRPSVDFSNNLTETSRQQEGEHCEYRKTAQTVMQHDHRLLNITGGRSSVNKLFFFANIYGRLTSSSCRRDQTATLPPLVDQRLFAIRCSRSACSILLNYRNNQKRPFDLFKIFME